jgi:ectoine hydroxylase-related dioxygenase (phytanoyl-CoA dioxygenase family)
VSAIANDPRLRAIAARFVGDTAVVFRATLFDKSLDANWLVPWHQDTTLPLRQRLDAPGWGPWSTKVGVLQAHAPTAALTGVVALRIHLDASTEMNGPLRVVPRSHLRGVLDDDAVVELAHRSHAVDCVVPRGGILAMRPLVVHASSKARSSARRRVLHVEYAASLALGDGLELAVA